MYGTNSINLCTTILFVLFTDNPIVGPFGYLFVLFDIYLRTWEHLLETNEDDMIIIHFIHNFQLTGSEPTNS